MKILKNTAFYTRFTYGESESSWFEPLVFITAIIAGCALTLGAIAFTFQCVIAFILGRVMNYDEDRCHAPNQIDCFKTSLGLMLFYMVFFHTSIPHIMIFGFIFFTTFALSNVDGVRTSLKKVMDRIFYFDGENNGRDFIRCSCCDKPIAEQDGIRCRRCKKINDWNGIKSKIKQ